jgi:hypothetical protein
MIELVPAATKTIISQRHGNVAVNFNGKVYNGKRYFNCTYRINNTRSGVKKATMIWEDGIGWLDSVTAWESDIETAFELVEKEDVTLSFGKHAGKKLSEVPVSYLRWLVSHKNVLTVSNQAIIEDVKAFLV